MRILLALALLAPLSAQAQSWPPYLAEVTGVAADDTLNVRRGPSGSTEDIGDLTNGSQLEITGLDGFGKWARIIWGGEDGWIARRYTREIDRPRALDSDMPVNMHCTGTEPFWSADILPESTFSFIGLEDRDTQYFTVTDSTQSVNYTLDYAFATLGSAMTGVLHQRECSDGMSESTYAWALDLVDRRNGGLTLLTGCCTALLQDGY